jgi:hypothetical protein
LVAQWRFEEGTGTLVADELGSHDGTASGMTWVNGKCGDYAGEFDGTDDCISVPSHNDLSFGDGAGNDRPFNFSAWVYYVDVGGNEPYAPILGKYGEVSPSYDGEYIFSVNDSDKLNLRLFPHNASGVWIGKATVASIPKSVWTHVSANYDGTRFSAGIELYINGVSQTLSDDTIGSQPNAGMDSLGADLTIGGCTLVPSAYSGYLEGRLDDIRIYNRTLDSSEVINVMNECDNFSSSSSSSSF